MRRIAGFTIVIAALALSALPLAAQDHTFHAAGVAPMHVAGGAPMHAAGTFAPTGRVGGRVVVGPSNGVRHHHEGQRRIPRYGYGYYVYGVPYLMPYDNGYDQPDNAANDQPAEEAQDNRPGPTVFEHDGQPASYRGREVEREEPQREQADNSAQPSTPLTPTILVFRDGHQQEIENYAIAGAKLIVLGERPQKIQLSDLDIDATTKLNDDRGVDFKLPNQT